MGASPAAMRVPPLSRLGRRGLETRGHCTRAPGARNDPTEMAWRNQANWPLTRTRIKPKWLGGAQPDEHSTRSRQAHGAAAPDPGAPGAAPPRAPPYARHEANRPPRAPPAA